MDFYRLKQPGSEWFSRQGDVSKAARAAGVEWEKVEVPDSKPERLAWLNANARGAPGPLVIPAIEEMTDEPAPARSSGKEETCPKCKWTPRMCERYVAMKLQGLTLDAIKEFIETRDGWELSTVIEAAVHRLSELAKLVSKKAG